MNIALLGYGRMGREVERHAPGRGHRVVLRLGGDATPVGPDGSAPAADAPSPDEALATADAAIDFSVAGAVPGHVERAARAGIPVVVGTTGWEDRVEEVRRTVEEEGIGLLHAPNFSLGIQLFYRLAALAARLEAPLGPYDVHVTETHHRHKVDHPSGTARRVADLLVENLESKDRWREGPADAEADATLQVSAVRVGAAAGTHAVGLDGPEDRIEIRHEARGRGGFARGALAAAEWLRGRTGWFTLEEMLADRLGGLDRAIGFPSGEGGSRGGTGTAPPPSGRGPGDDERGEGPGDEHPEPGEGER